MPLPQATQFNIHKNGLFYNEGFELSENYCLARSTKYKSGG